MNASDQRQSRRRLLKILTASGGLTATAKLLPERWTRPAVEAVLVPAHAALSYPGTGIYAQTQSTGMTSITGDNRLADLLISPAVAQPAISDGFSVCFDVTDFAAEVKYYRVVSGICYYYAGHVDDIRSFTNVPLTHIAGANSITIDISGALTGGTIIGNFRLDTTPADPYNAPPGDCSPVCTPSAG